MKPVGLYTFVPAANALDPAHSDPLLALSNGNLRATKTTNNTAWASSRVVTPKQTGKVYFEVMNVTGPSVFMGICNAAFNVNGLHLGLDAGNSIGGLASTGSVYINGARSFDIHPWTVNGQVGCWCIDFALGQYWARGQNNNWNGGGGTNPSTGVGGIALPPALLGVPIYAAVSALSNVEPSAAQINLGATAFTWAVPAGFVPWG